MAFPVSDWERENEKKITNTNYQLALYVTKIAGPQLPLE